jgi:hypothetical protein
MPTVRLLVHTALAPQLRWAIDQCTRILRHSCSHLPIVSAVRKPYFEPRIKLVSVTLTFGKRQAASASEPFKPASMRGTDERLPQLTQKEPYQIEALLKAGHPQSGIATVLKRDKPTISREVRRNCGLQGYRPKQAQRLALTLQSSSPRRRCA